MPISFSALCIMSLVMRGAGVGDGRGEGDGVGVCASPFSGDFDTASPAAPAAGSSLTKLRRLIDVRCVFFMGGPRLLALQEHDVYGYEQQIQPQLRLSVVFP